MFHNLSERNTKEKETYPSFLSFRNSCLWFCIFCNRYWPYHISDIRHRFRGFLKIIFPIVIIYHYTLFSTLKSNYTCYSVHIRFFYTRQFFMCTVNLQWWQDQQCISRQLHFLIIIISSTTFSKRQQELEKLLTGKCFSDNSSSSLLNLSFSSSSSLAISKVTSFFFLLSPFGTECFIDCILAEKEKIL